MIWSLRGTLLYSDTNSFVVECGGVGYKCSAPLSTLSSLPTKGNEVFVYTYMNVREDAIDLFGFATEAELDCFKLITSVSGVGPKIGLAVLSEYTPDKILLFIASGDYKMLTKASGVGTKLAQKIVFELKDKVGAGDAFVSADISNIGNAMKLTNSSDAVSALVAIGFSQSDAALAVGKLDPTMPVEEMIKQALSSLSRMV